MSESFFADDDVFFAVGVVDNDGGCGGGLNDEFGDGGGVFFPFDAVDFLSAAGAREGVDAGHDTESFSS